MNLLTPFLFPVNIIRIWTIVILYRSLFVFAFRLELFLLTKFEENIEEVLAFGFFFQFHIIPLDNLPINVMNPQPFGFGLSILFYQHMQKQVTTSTR